jgi:hypothetical protein
MDIPKTKDKVINKKSGTVHIKGIYQFGKWHRAHCGTESILLIKADDNALVTCNRCKQYITEDQEKRSKWTTLIMEEVMRWDDIKNKWLPGRLANLTDADIAGNDYDIKIEVSVVRKNNKHGLDSRGWGDLNKIILFDGSEDIRNKADIEWMKKVAKATADALNKERL